MSLTASTRQEIRHTIYSMPIAKVRAFQREFRHRRKEWLLNALLAMEAFPYTYDDEEHLDYAVSVMYTVIRHIAEDA